MVKRFDTSFDEYDPLFVTRTRASGSQARIYLRGLMQARRRNIERIRDAVPGSDEQALHHFIANSPWDHRPVLDKVARDANALLGGSDDSFLLIDETGFPKKGRDSVGVARQWCGRLGKVDNCQTAVCASLGKGSIATLIDTALFLPKEWTRDRARMAEAGIPEAFQTYRTKQELALDLIERALENGVQFSWVGFDGFYGDNGQLLRMLDGTGLTFMGDVHCDQYLDSRSNHRQERQTTAGRRVGRFAGCRCVAADRDARRNQGTDGGGCPAWPGLALPTVRTRRTCGT